MCVSCGFVWQWPWCQCDARHSCFKLLPRRPVSSEQKRCNIQIVPDRTWFVRITAMPLCLLIVGWVTTLHVHLFIGFLRLMATGLNMLQLVGVLELSGCLDRVAHVWPTRSSMVADVDASANAPCGDENCRSHK